MVIKEYSLEEQERKENSLFHFVFFLLLYVALQF